MLKFETVKGRIKCEIGDELLSYFVKQPNAGTEHHSFEKICQETLAMLKSKIIDLA